jgi:pimeloyl-ACP methyl ester carboxylesterase
MTVREWHKVMPTLAKRHRVIAVDLRGMGDSAKPRSGYDKKNMARDVHELVRHLGYDRVGIAGTDIGSMVAYSFAVNHPEATRRVALIEAPHPNESLHWVAAMPQPNVPHLWWLAFNQVDGLPEALLAGRSRLLIDWLIAHQAKDPSAIGERSRAIYAEAYDRPGAIRAANGWYQAFEQDIQDMRGYGPLEVPVLALGGLNFPALKVALASKANDIQFVELEGAGHYLAEERPDELAGLLDRFFAAVGQNEPNRSKS